MKDLGLEVNKGLFATNPPFKNFGTHTEYNECRLGVNYQH